jgi:uncharacterized protein (DUF58 family)
VAAELRPLADQQAKTAASYVDPAALMRIKNLQLRAKVVVEGFYNGLHKSPFHGFSAEFSEYRPYILGDDLRYLDWRLYARSDRFYIKRFEDETNRRCYLVLDASRSMGYSSLGYTKSEYANTLCATLAYYLTLQRDSVGLLTFDEAVVDFVAARHRPGHLRHLLAVLERPLSGRGTDLGAPLAKIAALVKKRGLIVILSDLLAPIASLRENLGYLRARGHELLLLRVVDPGEIEIPLRDATIIRDLETDREMYVDAADVRREYGRRFAEHEEQVRSICADYGIDFARIATDQPLERALYDLLVAQLRRGRTVQRARGQHSTPRPTGVKQEGRQR